MSNYLRHAIAMVEAARPASGFRPETETEWSALQAATLELVYAMFRDNGMASRKAREVAEQLYGGSCGRLLLHAAFKDDEHA